MREIRYVLADPTGNLTCLVLDPVDREDRPAVTARLMEECEQVGYLREAEDPNAAIRLEMMGGEFCGNASMATAALIAEEADLWPGQKLDISIEVSGAEDIVFCRILQTEMGYRGMIEMPVPTGMRDCEISGLPLTAVFLPGMVHLIYEGTLSREKAEAALEAAKAELPDQPAIGLLQYEKDETRMTPLVWVRDSDTMVWETACGSGTVAMGYYFAMKSRCTYNLTLTQPGGDLRAEAEWKENGVERIWLIGNVKLHPEQTLRL